MADAFRVPIVTGNEQMAKYVMRRAKELGRDVEAIAAAKLLSGSLDGLRHDRVIVDDADAILENALHRSIAAMTMSATCIKDWQ